MNVGVGLTLMGVSEMLFPFLNQKILVMKKIQEYHLVFLNGVQNTSRAGTSHPIVYGEIVTGSVVISAGIDTNQVTA